MTFTIAILPSCPPSVLLPSSAAIVVRVAHEVGCFLSVNVVLCFSVIPTPVSTNNKLGSYIHAERCLLSRANLVTAFGILRLWSRDGMDCPKRFWRGTTLRSRFVEYGFPVGIQYGHGVSNLDLTLPECAADGEAHSINEGA